MPPWTKSLAEWKKVGNHEPRSGRASVLLRWRLISVLPIMSAPSPMRSFMSILARMGLQEDQLLSDRDYRELFGKIQEGFFLGEIIRDERRQAVDFRFLQVNEAFSRQTGVSAAAALGRRVTEVVPGFPSEVVQTYASVVESGASTSLELQVPALGNRHYEARAHPVGDERFVLLFLETTQSKQIEQALQESQALLSDMVDTVDQMVWSARPDGFHDYFNRRWYEFTGAAGGTTNGGNWARVFHPDDRHRARERWQYSLQSGEPYEIEYRLRHCSGEYRWVLGRAHPVRDGTGKIIRWMGTCTDIHEQKTLSEDLELASNELSHRIKNIFAVVSALLTLSLRDHPEAEAYAEELHRRIEALREAHDYARPQGSRTVSAAPPATVLGLIDRLLQPYVVERHDRIVVEGDDVSLHGRASTPLSLALHELATNATKYGALSTAEGRVHIRGELSNGTYNLFWTETGGPPVTEPDQFGFGSRLVNVSLQTYLRGKLVRDWRPEGLRVCLSAPAEELGS